MAGHIANETDTKNAAEEYQKSALSLQGERGKRFIQTEVSPQPGDAILDLGCGTGELSAFLAGLVGPEGKVIGVDSDKERIKVARQSHSKIKNLSFVDANAFDFPGIGCGSYDLIFSNHVIHWIANKQQVFKNMMGSLKIGGKIAIQYVDHLVPFVLTAFKVLNPEHAKYISETMYQCEEKTMIEQYCSRAGFKIINSYEAISPEMVFESLEILLKWLWSTTHGVFDPTVVTEERLQRYYPYSSRNGKPPFDFHSSREESVVCRLIAVKQANDLA